MKQATMSDLKDMFRAHVNTNNHVVAINSQNYTAHEVLAMFSDDWKREFDFWLEDMVHDGKLLWAYDDTKKTFYYTEPTKKFKVKVEIRTYEVREIEVEATNPDEVHRIIYDTPIRSLRTLGEFMESGFFIDDAVLINEITEAQE